MTTGVLSHYSCIMATVNCTLVLSMSVLSVLCIFSYRLGNDARFELGASQNLAAMGDVGAPSHGCWNSDGGAPGCVPRHQGGGVQVTSAWHGDAILGELAQPKCFTPAQPRYNKACLGAARKKQLKGLRVGRGWS